MKRAARIQADRDQIRRVVGPLLAGEASCALIGYPDHWNAGDSAIWCGTRCLLRDVKVRVDYACDAWSYDPDALTRAIPAGPILLAGGGNFGDVYPIEADLRARVLRDFPSRRIIQLPQSIWFRDPAGMDEMGALLAAQRDFTLLVRDKDSLDLARAHWPCPTGLCPDLALYGGWQAGPRPRRPAPVLALWRTDIEGGADLPERPAGWIVRDWITCGEECAAWSAVDRLLQRWVGPPPTALHARPSLRRALTWRTVPAAWDRLARIRCDRGFQILAGGRVVLTNRLHAHLLCLLTGQPHVVCDSASQKLSAYRRTWPLDDSSVVWASSPEEGVAAAQSPF